MSYRASAAAVGNSKGLRLDGALFREHPEFANGTFEVDVIAPGRMLVRAKAHAVTQETQDPVLDAFLGFLGHQMASRPDLLTGMTASDLREVDELVAGVEVDDDEEFGEDLELP
jgi:hypothetical protein